MVHLVQIVPRNGVRLYGEMVRKEIELLKKKRGTFRRSGPKERNRAKWSHARYLGWINLERAAGEVVTAEVRSLSHAGNRWQLLHAFIGWLDRHFGGEIQAINIQYVDE